MQTIIPISSDITLADSELQDGGTHFWGCEGEAPTWVQGQAKPLFMRSEGRIPSEADDIFVFQMLISLRNCHIKFGKLSLDCMGAFEHICASIIIVVRGANSS